MISYKILGGGLILGTGIAAAFLGVRREKRKLLILDGWIDLISLIRNQIDCYLTPLDEILQKAEPLISLPQAKEGAAPTLFSLFDATAWGLGEEEKRLINEFVHEIGNGYREDQIQKCGYYLESLRSLRRARAAELSPRIRVMLAVSLCASLGAAILLW